MSELTITQAMLNGTVRPEDDIAAWLWSHAFRYALPAGTEDAEAYATWYVEHCDPTNDETWTDHTSRTYGFEAWREAAGR
jgi:hypothetical protein